MQQTNRVTWLFVLCLYVCLRSCWSWWCVLNVKGLTLTLTLALISHLTMQITVTCYSLPGYVSRLIFRRRWADRWKEEDGLREREREILSCIRGAYISFCRWLWKYRLLLFVCTFFAHAEVKFRYSFTIVVVVVIVVVVIVIILSFVFNSDLCMLFYVSHNSSSCLLYIRSNCSRTGFKIFANLFQLSWSFKAEV